MKPLFLALALQILAGPILSYDITQEEIKSYPPEYRLAANNFSEQTKRKPYAQYDGTLAYLNTDAFYEVDPNYVAWAVNLVLPISHANMKWRRSRDLKKISIVDADNKVYSLSFGKLNPVYPKGATLHSPRPQSLKIWVFRVYDESQFVDGQRPLVKAFVWCEKGMQLAPAAPALPPAPIATVMDFNQAAFSGVAYLLNLVDAWWQAFGGMTQVEWEAMLAQGANAGINLNMDTEQSGAIASANTAHLDLKIAEADFDLLIPEKQRAITAFLQNYNSCQKYQDASLDYLNTDAFFEVDRKLAPDTLLLPLPPNYVDKIWGQSRSKFHCFLENAAGARYLIQITKFTPRLLKRGSTVTKTPLLKVWVFKILDEQNVPKRAFSWSEVGINGRVVKDVTAAVKAQVVLAASKQTEKPVTIEGMDVDTYLENLLGVEEKENSDTFNLGVGEIDLDDFVSSLLK